MNVADLAALTVKNPAEAARRLMVLNLSREVLWLALALAVVLNTLLQVVSNLLYPAEDPQLQELASSIVLYVVVVGGGLILSIAAFYQIGQRMGGTGSFSDIMTLMVWLQFLRAAVQAISLIILLTVPGLLDILAIGAFLLGLYITVHFIDQAHSFGSPLKAFGVLIFSAIAIAVLITLLLSLVGGPMLGIPAHV